MDDKITLRLYELGIDVNLFNFNDDGETVTYEVEYDEEDLVNANISVETLEKEVSSLVNTIIMDSIKRIEDENKKSQIQNNT